MADCTFLDNPEYSRALGALQEHHQLMHEGRGESEAAEAARDEMMDLWNALSEDERQFLWGVSADLYMLEDKEIPEPADDSDRAPEFLRPLIARALAGQDWRRVLTLLRKNPDVLDRSSVAFLRATAYEGMAHLNLALAFLRYALRLEPQNYDYRYRLTELYVRTGHLDEALVLAEEHLAASDSPPDIRMQASALLYLSAQNFPADQAQPVLTRVIREVRKALTDARSSQDLNFYSAYAYVTLGFCYEALGDRHAAEEAYEESLRLIPGFPEGRRALARLRSADDLRVGLSDLAQSHSPLYPPPQARPSLRAA